MTYQVRLQAMLDPPWLRFEPIFVGRKSGTGTPAAYVTVMVEGQPFARVDAYVEDSGAFADAVSWGRFVVLGMGCAVHLIDPVSRQIMTIACDGYFGHLYPQESCLLIASASALICLNLLGITQWRRSNMAIDGVVIEHVKNGIIYGSGEWDPPGGWRPFQLSLDSGLPVVP